jgi:phage terminase large subunit-like protein
MARRATTASKSLLPSSPAEVGKAWAHLLRLLPEYDPFAQGEGYGFDTHAAGRAIGWMEHHLKLAKGRKARQSFILEPWQKCIVANLFGWKHLETGLRRYRSALLYVPKKNGKSAFGAAIMLYVIAEDDEIGAELYSAAASRDQAAIIFSHAVGMVRQSKVLSDRLTMYGVKGGSQMRSIVDDSQMSVYKCLSADANTADGANVHFALVDELHRHKTPELAEVLEKSSAERSQPMILYTTTADYNRPSLCNTTLKYAKQVRENKGDPTQPGYDPGFLPVIYEATDEDDWQDPAVWAKANPNYGVTIPEDFMRRQCKKAQDIPSELNNFLRLHLNIVTDAEQAWLDMKAWDLCSTAGDDPVAWRERMLEEMAGERAIAALDLSSTNDLTALVLLFPDRGNVVIPFFWAPRDNAEKREREHQVPYLTWARQGFIDLTDGNYVDQAFVLHRTLECCDQFGIRELTFDRYMARQIQMETDKHGIDVVPFGQGFIDMTGPSKRLEIMVMSGEMDHGDNPVLRWNAGNTMIRRDPAGNIKPDKSKSAEKIDGIVSLVMAIGRSMVTQDEEMPWMGLL